MEQTSQEGTASPLASAGAPLAGAPRARRRWRVPAVVAGIVLVGAVAALTVRLIQTASPAVELPLAGRLALLPFEDATAERSDAWVQTGLTEMVAEAVARTAGAALVAPERLRQTLEPRGVELRDPASREQARRLALASGADQVLDARVLQRGERATIEVQLFAASGLVDTGRVEGSGVLEAADTLAFSLARELGSEIEPRRMKHAFSRSPFWDRLYAAGLEALRTAGPETARGYFEIALRHRPDFLQARSRLAECALRLGDLERARQLAGELVQAAQARGERALEAEALGTLAHLAALDGDLAQAADDYSRAFEIHVGRGDRAAQAAVLFELARIALARGAPERAEEHYVEMLRIQQDVGDRLGEIETLYQIGSLQLAGSDLEGAGRVLADARELALSVGDAWAEMRVLASLGEVALRRGETEAAKAHWRRALQFYRERREEDSRRLLLNYKLAEALVATGELDEAEGRLHDLRELAAERGDRRFEARASVGLAWLMLRTGYPYQAKPHLDRALELDRWLEDRKLLQLVIAWYAYEQGNYRLALETQQEAKRQATTWGAVDEEFLQVYRQAENLGRRLPVPGEDRDAGPA